MDRISVKNNALSIMVFIALILALSVVMFGAYTRLTDAGLGCPDWPGCYGKMMLPQDTQSLKSAQSIFPQVPIQSRKAWTEMIHRYAAACLGLLIFSIALITFRKRLKNPVYPLKTVLFLIFLLIFQALLGMWTVTLKLLPLVVMGHLLGGMLIFTSLSYFWVQISMARGTELPAWRAYIRVGIIIVLVQIALGGWVSSNYAGLACLGFPTCNGNWLPSLYFAKAFNISLGSGLNYQGGLLDNEVRVTIQMVHRFGAIITATYVLILSALIILKSHAQSLKIAAWILASLVILQFTLGVLNVMYWLPIPIAVAHNGVAALLLAAMASSLHFTRGAHQHDN